MERYRSHTLYRSAWGGASGQATRCQREEDISHSRDTRHRHGGQGTIPEHTVEERVVGLHVMGPSAEEVIQGFAVALKCGLIKQQLDTTVGLHPVCAQVLTKLTVTQHAADTMMVRGNC
ncbi:thioredoxin reductase 1, cytoplasmic isoform X1 [Salmo trutta]|uniref:thioredoxin reductase 1, cytoplasmic isoform X1 n=1 Tax=Salmo trutta TaxID=8032 RepID=UPI00113243FC|nr:thioredoxin reductase 1, cytoplasmic-like isoform X1 [Salmo trutta]XP_029598724.1 thioredoxin reductase 1, cytoplasmic-like isoform X1 [Salmo trutta]